MAASSRFVLPRQQYIQSNSVIGSGWRLYFYISGTSTPQAVYSDATLVTPIDQTNGIASDGNGNFPDIFLGANAYKVLLIAPLATVASPTWTADPVQAVTVANASTSTAGIIQLATTAQALAAASTTLGMTPATTAAMIQQGGYAYAGNGSGSANAEVAALNPVPSAYASGMAFLVRAGFTNTGAMTANFNSLGAVAVKKQGAAGATPLVAGDYVTANLYLMIYVGADSCLYLFDSHGSVIPGVGLAGNTNFTCTNKAGTENTQLTINGAAVPMQVVLVDANGVAVSVSSSATFTLIATNIGVVNGLDAGALGNSLFYYIWAIYNQSTGTLGYLLSLSSTAPTMPSGYTFKCLCGEVVTSAAAAFLRTIQVGKDISYKVTAGSNTTALPATIPGGIVNTQTRLAATVVGNTVPPTASRIKIIAGENGAANSQIVIAPNGDAGYSAVATVTGPPPIAVFSAGGGTVVSYAEIVLESTQLFYSSGTAAAANCTAQTYGWTTRANVT